STWNGSDQTSVAIPSALPEPLHLEEADPEELSRFVQGRDATLRRVALPRSYLGPKTLWSFTSPRAPGSVSAALPSGTARGPLAIEEIGGQVRVMSKAPPSRSARQVAESGPPGSTARDEIVFDADAGRWHGDLGAFLRDTMVAGKTHARV